MPAIAMFADDRLAVSVGAFTLALTVKEIERAWDALSHFPNRRARHELGYLAERLNTFADHLDVLTARGGQLDIISETERFAVRHVSLTRRAWSMDSRCMSWFIVGPARFPVDRNRKKMEWADNAYRAIRDHVDAARKAVERVAFPHGAPCDAIRASNPDAPELLRARIAERKTAHAMMKAANAAIRSVKSGHIDEIVQAVVDATGWREDKARQVVAPPEAWMGRGFPAYALSSELAEIKRLEGRLVTIKANRARGNTSRKHNTTTGAVEVIENGDAARIQMVFDGKPSAQVRDLLKSNGFRWAPSEGAWQRHLNNGGRYAVTRVIDALQVDDHPSDQKAAPPVSADIYRTMGRHFTITAAFDSDDEANAYLAEHDGEGVIACDNGRVLIAALSDAGKRAG